jgi:enoyl-[acyl-carrier protein] reductase I
LTDFDLLIEKAAKEAPLHQLVTIDAIGKMSAFLVSKKAQYITS